MKKFKLVLATSAVLLGSISVLATSNFTKGNDGFTLTSVIEGNKEVVGVKRAMVEEGDKAVFTEGEGTSLQVSPAMTQVVTNEDGTTNLRFVAAVKADLTGSAVNAVKAVMPGDVGFHVSYGEKDVTYDVEHAYSSMVAGGNFYYANEYSSWYGENGTNNENNKPMTDWLALGGFEDNGYNLFIALEVQNIPEESLDTLFKVQTYVRSEDGTYEYSKYTKLADAKGSPLYWLSVDGTYDVTTSRMDANPENETVAGKDEYMKLGVSLTTGQTVSVVDSYGREIKNYENVSAQEDGYYHAVRDGEYNFYYKTPLNTLDGKSNSLYVGEPAIVQEEDIVIESWLNDWASNDSAQMYVYYWGENLSGWSKMELTTDNGSFGDFYVTTLIDVKSITGFKFVRFKANVTEPSWEAEKHNEGSDISYSDYLSRMETEGKYTYYF